jgi:ribonuclease HI
VMATVTLYTDGACKGNPGRGGNELWRQSGREEYTTNNRMELMGPIAGLDEVMRRGWRGEEVHVKTDSTYVANGITKWIGAWVRNGWVTKTGEPVKNAELWRRLLAHKKAMGERLKW